MNQANAIYINTVQQLDVIDEIDLEKLFSEQYKHLSSFIEKRVSHKEDAEDILQSTFYEALRNHKNFKGNSKPETWLFGIAVNLIRNYFKKLYTANMYEDLSEVDRVFQDVESDPSLIVERQAHLAAVLAGIDDLPGYARNIVDLVLDMDCSYQAAADYMGIPIGTVRSRLFRARKLLKEAVSLDA